MAESTLFCVTGTALGAAVGALFDKFQQPKPDISVQLAKFLKEDNDKAEPEKHSGLFVNMADKAWEGFTMADARAHNSKLKSDFQDLTPPQVLSNLQRGNARFWTGVATRPEANAFQRRALIMQQFPSAAVLGCSDSRVPTELVFDQPLGELFVVRVAGNITRGAPMASLLYAVNHLKVKVVLVMGHEGCGALKAAELPVESLDDMDEELGIALKSIKAGFGEDKFDVHDQRARDREVAIANVRAQVKGLFEDPSIQDKVVAGKLLVVGCFYEISSGIVDFFNYLPQGNEQVSHLLRAEIPIF
eukprot:TRINITY_DN20291_c0_g1_i1.p1 TRINITY_DN20291_c0_g1~~TRINITY_DN20291_c0_g1_i1.p1  ORF type:complete len:303 (-),score=73.61 TRINITY_DN20291_c0_g1_i1:93-1001(-)